MTVDAPFEVTISIIPEPDFRGPIRVYLVRPDPQVSAQETNHGMAGVQKATTALEQSRHLSKTWIFQASPKFSDVKGALRSIEAPVCLVRQFRNEIKPGDTVYLWECGPGGGIVGVAEVSDGPRIQAEPAAQLPFIRESEKFAGDRLRVKLQILKRISPVIPRKYLLSRPELTDLTILRCPRGTNFRVTQEQAAVLQRLVEQVTSFVPGRNGSDEKRIVFAEG